MFPTRKLAFLAAGLAMLLAAPSAAVAATDKGEATPLNLPSTDGSQATTASSGGGLVRTFVGLAIVLGVIYGLYWVLKQVKSSRETAASGDGLESVASIPLGTNRSLHLVRAGRELVLLGVSEQSVVPIRAYREEEARALGPHRHGGHDRRRRGDARGALPPRRRRAARHPRPPPAAHGALVKVEGSNAIQILLMLGGITLVPALLFTVTGFSRILIVLGFIRSGLGTPTAPPNQVLVGIALFLTIFVMQPTFAQVKKEAWDPLQQRKITQVEALDRAQGPMREFMFRQTRTKDIALFAGMAKLERPQDPRRHPDLRPDPGLHHQRAQDGVPDRLPDLPAVPRDRPRRLLDADVAWAW